MTPEDVRLLEERLAKLAADKSYLQLLIHMINQVNAQTGLEETVTNILSAVTDTIGGTNAILYYPIEGGRFRVADLFGRREVLGAIDDPEVAAVFATRSFLERASDFSETLMKTEEFGKAYTWVFPLLAGDELVGVFKLENLHIGSAGWQEHLTTFFRHAALSLSNEIRSHSRLSQTNEELERRVERRTQILAETNRRLQEELQRRVGAEKAVRDKEEEYRFLFERIGAGVVVHDAETNIIRINVKALDILGVTLDQALGKSAMDPAWHFTNQEGWPIPLEEYPVNRVIASKAPLEGLVIGVNRPSSEDQVWLVVNGSPAFDAAGNVRQVVISFMDITGDLATREELARLSYAIDQSVDGLIITEPDGTIIYANRAFTTTTGYSLEETLGKTPAILKSHKNDPSLYRQMWEAIMSATPWHGTVVNRRKDGTLYNEALTISPISDAEGAIRYFVGNMHDITHEAAFARARDHFSSIVAHEIRTPLTKLELVKIFVANVAATIPDQDTARQLSTILDEAMEGFGRISHITNVFTHLVSHGGQGRTSKQDLSLIVPSAVSLAQQRAEMEGRQTPVTYTSRFPQGEASVFGDHFLLNMAIEELLSNAIKYSPDGSPVTVTLMKEGERGVMEIKDRGKGIPPESLDIVFEPFYSLEDKLHHSTGKYKHLGGGLGLGLTVVRLVAEVHGGLLELTSEGEGKGCLVRMTLPLAAMKDE